MASLHCSINCNQWCTVPSDVHNAADLAQKQQFFCGILQLRIQKIATEEIKFQSIVSFVLFSQWDTSSISQIHCIVTEIQFAHTYFHHMHVFF